MSFAELKLALHHLVQRMSATTAIHGIKLSMEQKVGEVAKLIVANPKDTSIANPQKIWGTLEVENLITGSWVNQSGGGPGGSGGSDGNLRAKIHGPFSMGSSNLTSLDLPETFSLSGKVLHVYRSGIALVEGVHWQAADNNTITFLDPCLEGEVIEVIEYEKVAASSSGGSSASYEIVTETAIGVVSSTDGFDGNGTFTVSAVMLDAPAPKVYISGVFLLIEGTQYTWVGNTISILSGFKPISSAAGSEYVMVEYAKETV